LKTFSVPGYYVKIVTHELWENKFNLLLLWHEQALCVCASIYLRNKQHF